ncbi:MAG: hypothetical protein GX306_11760 [Clostridiales bacterium]|jgi:hypothetical protein|nr:hypothetical protein [Clostridiales bacterium]
MIQTKTLIRYITEEEYLTKLISRLEKGGDFITGQWLVLDENDALSQKYSGIELFRKDKKIIFTMYGTPICIAAYAGNVKLVDYLIREGLLEDWPESYFPESNTFTNDDLFEPQICCTMMTETDKTYSEYNERFHNISPISFTLPGGKIECFRLLLEAGEKCDFRNRNNFKLLAFCQNKIFWEYLVDCNFLNQSLLMMAAEYAFHYRNTETALWLLKHFNLLKDFDR